MMIGPAEKSGAGAALRQVYAHHPREWRQFRYVYPVISRRSKGLSIGVNLNPDKVCNFDCVYCSVDRRLPVPAGRRSVDLAVLQAELEALLAEAVSGRIWSDTAFAAVPAELRRINDIALSGDGEPTTYRRFAEVCELIAAAKARQGLTATKIVLITNATRLDRPTVQRGLAVLDANQGEVWAKLDAGTEAYYKLIDRTKYPLAKVLRNIRACGQERDIVIQSLFMSYQGKAVSDAEFDEYGARLAELVAGGCRIKLVQLYTVARNPAEPTVLPLTDAELDRLALRLRAAAPGLSVETYYGVG
jgi:wyosine [tRNA(Phe)-imidazoG37] synthetase (radical SAM superfamily)